MSQLRATRARARRRFSHIHIYIYINLPAITTRICPIAIRVLIYLLCRTDYTTFSLSLSLSLSHSRSFFVSSSLSCSICKNDDSYKIALTNAHIRPLAFVVSLPFSRASLFISCTSTIVISVLHPASIFFPPPILFSRLKRSWASVKCTRKSRTCLFRILREIATDKKI